MASNQISRHRGSKNDVWLFVGIMALVTLGPWLAEIDGEEITEMFGIVLIGFWPGILMVVLWFIYEAIPKKPETPEERMKRMEDLEASWEASRIASEEFSQMMKRA